VEEALALGYPDMQALAMQRATERGVRWTVLDSNGEPRACFGIADTAVPGVGSMWLLRTEDAAPFVKTGFKVLRAILAVGEYRRIEATARGDCLPCRRFVEWLGFKHEGTKRRFFTDGCCAEMYAWTKEA
jgi:RimJ/RimL family protein N-acetyltransferase